MKHLYVLCLLFLMISCDRGLDSMNAYNYYQKCKEAKNIDFSSITPHSTCNGINIILSIYLDEDSISSEGINYILYSVFKDKKGQLDWKAMESFREPGSGKTLGHIIAEYGDFSEIQEMFERYSKSNLIILHDTFDENIFHKLAQNSISDFYLKKYCAAVPALRELSSRVNIFNLTPAQVAVSKGNFSKAFSLYGCSRKKETMAGLFAEHGLELSFNRDIVEYPELFDYMAPYLMEEKEVELYYGSSVQRRSLFELHRFSTTFGQFIIKDEVIYFRFMGNSEVMRRILNSMRSDTYDSIDGYKQSAIFYYAYSGLDDRSLFKDILEKTNPTLLNLRKESIYHVLAKNGKRKELKLALRKLSDNRFLLVQNINGQTALDVCEGETCKVLRKATPAL